MRDEQEVMCSHIIPHRHEIIVFSRDEPWEHGDTRSRASSGEERVRTVAFQPHRRRARSIVSAPSRPRSDPVA
jgi:hypothetical protein